jgi:chloramphenicol-sensitive protein RarD
MKNNGIWYAFGCYMIWGVFPLYWKLLINVPATQIVAHRLVWSFVFLLIFVSLLRQWRGFRGVLDRRTLLIYFTAGLLLSVNWLVYVYGVNAGFVVETSLGYFINPLVSILLGVIFLGEKLPVTKWIPIGVAAAGVAYLTISYGRLPWIALALAVSFGLYGLVKKLSPLGALHGLTLETAAMFLPSVGYLLFIAARGTGAFGQVSLTTNLLLMLAGVVTSVPLLLFSSAARRIPLSMIGIMQFITPTMQFFLGVFLYHEPFTHDRMVGFGIIWIALGIFTFSSLYERARARAREVQLVGDSLPEQP